MIDNQDKSINDSICLCIKQLYIKNGKVAHEIQYHHKLSDYSY
jgi:hypothetical protein